MEKKQRTVCGIVCSPISFRVGIKVRWFTFETREEAEAVRDAIIEEANKRFDEGYDFGYNCPGHISETKDGHFEICAS